MVDPILPTITDLNRPFWDGAAAGELRLQRCITCGHLRYPISSVCPACLSPDAEWVALSGSGTVLSYVRFHRSYHPAWEHRVPYVVALVQLDEGPRLFSNIAGDDSAVEVEVEVDDRVEAVFEPDPTGAVTLPLFRRSGQADA
jgi:uncharacterized OB-fold protein